MSLLPGGRRQRCARRLQKRDPATWSAAHSPWYFHARTLDGVAKSRLALLSRHFRKVDVRLPEKGNSDSHGAKPVYLTHLDDCVDSDQQLVNKDSLSRYLNPFGTVKSHFGPTVYTYAPPPSTLQ